MWDIALTDLKCHGCRGDISAQADRRTLWRSPSTETPRFSFISQGYRAARFLAGINEFSECIVKSGI